MVKKILYGFIFFYSPLFACSNIFINQGEHHIASRTMDFPFNTGNVFGVGLKGQKNQSNTAISNVPDGREATWTTTHNYIGQTWLSGPDIVDGMNDAGVSAAFLYLPDISSYPKFNKNDKRPALNMYESINFVLSQATSTKDALAKLNTVQTVEGGFWFYYQGKSGFMMKAPGHLVIRDKTGDSAVIEWIHGTIHVYPNAGPVITNAPEYSWQIKHASQYNYVQSKKNIAAKFDNQFMNGSGFIGLPGDFTPPNRFARATQVIRNMPQAQNHNEAIRFALSAIETIQVPVGSSDSPTFWKTVSDLDKATYYYYPLLTLSKDYAMLGQKGVEAYSPDITNAWQTYKLSELSSTNLPKKSVLAMVSKKKKSDVKKIVDWLHIPTPGPTNAELEAYNKQVQKALMVKEF